MTEKLNTLEGVKVGDTFMAPSGGWHSFLEKLTCTRVSPKQATIGGKKYRISDARELGKRRSFHGRGALMAFDEAAYGEDRERKTAQGYRSSLAMVRWDAVSDAAVRRIWQIFEEDNKASKEASHD